jgi:two-component system OmpR family response regulator
MTKTPHILIVDDHREIRELVSRALAKEGFRVSLAADGKAMRKVLADAQIDLPRREEHIEYADHHGHRQG